MIVETGRVVTIADGKAVIEIEKGTACAKCHVGCACDIEKSLMRVEANDPVGVHQNQVVQITIPTESAVQAACVVYGVPLLALILGTLLGERVGNMFDVENVFEIFGGFGFLGLSLFFIGYYDKLFRKNLKNQPVITKVIG